MTETSWDWNGDEIELTAADRETLLYLVNAEMASTTDIMHACDSIDYRRKALRSLDTLEDFGLLQTRKGEQEDDTPINPPRIAMLSTAGERFVSKHDAALATAEMDHDDVREEVYRLQEELTAVPDQLDDRLSAVEAQLDNAGMDDAALRADLDELADRVEDMEDSLRELPRAEDIDRMRRQVDDAVDEVRAEAGERHRKLRARVGDLETDMEVVEEAVESLEDWRGTVENRWQADIQPWISYWYENSDTLESMLSR